MKLTVNLLILFLFVSCEKDFSTIKTSSDNGTSKNGWFTYDNISNKNILEIFEFKNEIYVIISGIDSSSSKKILLSPDGGINWKDITGNILQRSEIRVSDTLQNTIILGSDKGIFLSDAQFGQWIYKDYGLLGDSLFITELVTKSNSIYITTWGNGAYLSTDLGESWQAIDSNIPYNYGRWTTIWQSDSVLFLSGGGLYKSYDNGQNWENASTGIPYASLESDINAFARKDTLLFAASLWYVFRSSNEGSNWEVVLRELSRYFTCFLVVSDNIYLGSDKGIYISRDNGNQWTEVNFNIPESLFIRHLLNFDNKLFIVTIDGFFIRDFPQSPGS